MHLIFQIALLQENQTSLHDEFQKSVKPNESLAQQIVGMGFDIELVRQALTDTTNDMAKAIENLLKMQTDGTYQGALQEALENMSKMASAAGINAPSTSQTVQNLQDEQEVNDSIF